MVRKKYPGDGSKPHRSFDGHAFLVAVAGHLDLTTGYMRKS